MKLLENEQIKQIKDFPKYYITSTGRVWSDYSNKWLKPTISKRGNYQRAYVSLGRKNKRYIHRLVAEAFLENPYNLNEVDHLDANGLNNNVENLKWVTHQENMKNEITVANVKKNTGYLIEIESLETGEKFLGVETVAKHFNVSKTTVNNHLKEKVKNPRWKATGIRKRP